MDPTQTPPDVPAETAEEPNTGLLMPPIDITPAADEVQYVAHQPTASQRRRMSAPPTRLAVAGKPNNRAYRRAEAAYKRKHPDPKLAAKED